VIPVPALVSGINIMEIDMNNNRQVEVFSAGCPVCEDVVRMVKASACPSCDVTILNTNDIQVAQRAKALGIFRVPAVVIDGKLADCCSGGAINEATLKAAGLGQAKA
jgi:glutaredoxin 3